MPSRHDGGKWTWRTAARMMFWRCRGRRGVLRRRIEGGRPTGRRRADDAGRTTRGGRRRAVARSRAWCVARVMAVVVTCLYSPAQVLRVELRRRQVAGRARDEVSWHRLDAGAGGVLGGVSGGGGVDGGSAWCRVCMCGLVRDAQVAGREGSP